MEERLTPGDNKLAVIDEERDKSRDGSNKSGKTVVDCGPKSRPYYYTVIAA